MRIAVMGAGGIGGNLGGLLARSGNDVSLIVRGEHLEAIRQHGLRVKMPQDEFTVHVHASNDPDEVGPVDLVLYTVKTYHNAAAIPAMVPMVGETTVVLSLQNGIESFDELDEVWERSSQAIETPHCDGVASLQVSEQSIEAGAGPASP